MVNHQGVPRFREVAPMKQNMRVCLEMYMYMYICTDIVHIHKAQGAIGALRKLKQLRDEVNSIG